MLKDEYRHPELLGSTHEKVNEFFWIALDAWWRRTLTQGAPRFYLRTLLPRRRTHVSDGVPFARGAAHLLLVA